MKAQSWPIWALGSIAFTLAVILYADGRPLSETDKLILVAVWLYTVVLFVLWALRRNGRKSKKGNATK
jgi:type VI protein secretion system component VasK